MQMTLSQTRFAPAASQSASQLRIHSPSPDVYKRQTLIRAIAALIDSTGEILLDGKPVRKMKRREIAARIAVMSQVTQIYFPFAVYDTVMLGRYQHMSGRLFGQPSAEDREMVEQCLQSVRLDGLRDRRIDELSGGQRQRVFLAQALAQDPEAVSYTHLDVYKRQARLGAMRGTRTHSRPAHFPAVRPFALDRWGRRSPHRRNDDDADGQPDPMPARRALADADSGICGVERRRQIAGHHAPCLLYTSAIRSGTTG